jgi:hypothetical protein
MNAEQQLTSTRLWIAVLNLDLQLYKGSIYKQRWGTPGGIDQALPCYDEALRTIDASDWPVELADGVADLRTRVAAYRKTLEAQDVTTASAVHTRMIRSFEALREAVRAWPDASAAAAPSAPGRTEPSRLNMDEAIPSG